MQLVRQGLETWCLGFVTSLQLQKCLVFFVLDTVDHKRCAAKVKQCFLLNGAIFLGSILAWDHVLHPSVGWLLGSVVRPVWGAWTASVIDTSLHVLYQSAWLLPVYLVTLFVCGTWYQEIASIAFKIKQDAINSSSGNAARGSVGTKSRPDVHSSNGNSHGASAVSSSSSSGGSGGSNHKMYGVAQEVYRLVLFMVFYTEILLLSKLPYAGTVVSTVFLSWLYAYYCYDYKWSLERITLDDRIAYFERRWPFFLGFGMPMALMCMVLPFYVGGAVLSLTFPLFVLVACDSDVDALLRGTQVSHAYQPSSSAQLAQGMGRMPVFKIALWPTQHLVKRILGHLPHGKTQ